MTTLSFRDRSGENNPMWKGGKVPFICKQCKKQVMVSKSQLKTRTFCSRKCQGDYLRRD